jgi:hypothetical protein
MEPITCPENSMNGGPLKGHYRHLPSPPSHSAPTNIELLRLRSELDLIKKNQAKALKKAKADSLAAEAEAKAKSKAVCSTQNLFNYSGFLTNDNVY